MGGRSCTVLLLLGALLVQLAMGYKHKLEVKNDNRQQFFIENFGFVANGKLIMHVTDWKVYDKKEKETVQDYTKVKDQIYFYIKITDQDSSEVLDEESPCKEGRYPHPNEFAVNDVDWTKTSDKTITIMKDAQAIEGLYNLYFINCNSKVQEVSFNLHLEQYNVDKNGRPDYLPIGLSPIPTIYAVFALIYAIIFVIWIFGYMRGKGNILNKVHYLMSILVFLKCISLFFYSVEQHFVKYDGTPNGWQIAYYIFAILRTSFFFIVVTLIGTGWSFFKPFLSDKDKKIIMVVIPLQILDNVAMVIVDTTDPGSLGLFTWKDIFRIVDIICCGAILIPIIWSIKHLREASQSDGKAARNLQKLQLFRQFYLIVVSYIYFTRIIVYLLDATLPYKLEFLGDICTEGATLAFFCVVGHKFRPMKGNPYFNLEDEDAARSEEMRASEDF